VQKDKPAPTMKIVSVDRFGLMEIAFSEPLIPPESITMIDSSALEISVKATNEELQSLLAFTWEAKSYYSTKLRILLTFKYPG
jgi:hypothetical protein